ncbi:hypothetical protein RFI_04112 [Reticulomyxa filosa]|uniref:Uncharacterized protein n=1 Tax=Reticulomyxa filosa TaxID=46433 RepID=X6P383_RETFI|nr:hypothetical protein RFI_04112 [Reticulomyxa filosa]|eukprot:ETO32995.1 hypothetical protein RFI_04112 [Reticulomyxa filosa]
MTESIEEKDEEEEEIFTYLKNTIKIDRDDASKLASYLRREEKTTQGEDISILESQQWKKAFAHVQLALISKKKLLKMVNKIRESEKEELLNIDEIINSRSSIRRQEYTQIMYLHGNTAIIILEEKQVRFNLNDDRWKSFNLRNGDEILCEYSFESNSNASNSGLSVDNIKFPVLYQSEVNEDDDFQFVLVQVHCIKSQQETKVKLVNDGQKKEKLKIGDKMEFRCKYHNDEWTAVDIKILQRASLRRIVDIKVTTTVKNKQEKAFQILNWLEHPLEGTIQSMLHAYVHIFSPKSRASKLIVHVSEKIDWSNFEDIAVSDDLVNYYKDLHDSPQKDENDNKLQWLKMQITLEAMKYVAKECIIEVCSIPNELIERIIRNLKHCSGSSSMTDSDSTNISHAIVLLRRFIEKYHNTNEEEEEDLTKLQKELEQIEALPILIEQQTVDNMYWIVSKQAINPRRLRIYLYCPGCIKIKPDRIRSCFFP